MHDTTRSLEAADDDSAVVHGSSVQKGKDAAGTTMISSTQVVDEKDDSSHGKAVEEILESRSKPGNLPKSNKSDGSSRTRQQMHSGNTLVIGSSAVAIHNRSFCCK